MTDTTTLAAQLAAQFDHHDKIRRGTVELDYLDVFQVVTRLNDVLGVDGWSYEVLEHGNDEGKGMWARGRLTALIEGRTVIREQFGECGLNSGMSVGDARKGAASDACKKCASLLGVGLYLASDEWKAAQNGAPASGARPPNRAPAAAAPPALAPTLQGGGWVWPRLEIGKLPPRRLEFRGGPNERTQQFLAACAQYLQLQQGDIQRALGGGLKDYMAAEKARRLAAADGRGDPITYGYEDVYATLWDLSREDESPAVRLLQDDRAPVTA